MPTTIFLRNGSKFTLKGSGPGAVIKRFLRPMAAGIAVNGHLVEFRWRERIFVDAQPEAEYQEELAKQAQAQEGREGTGRGEGPGREGKGRRPGEGLRGIHRQVRPGSR